MHLVVLQGLQYSSKSGKVIINPLNGRDVNWLHFAIQV